MGWTESEQLEINVPKVFIFDKNVLTAVFLEKKALAERNGIYFASSIYVKFMVGNGGLLRNPPFRQPFLGLFHSKTQSLSLIQLVLPSFFLSIILRFSNLLIVSERDDLGIPVLL